MPETENNIHGVSPEEKGARQCTPRALVWIIRLNNWWVRKRRIQVPAEALLLLVPHCLQASDCTAPVRSGIDECRRCGQCDLTGLLEIKERFGIRCNLASGGRQALGYVKDPAIRAVVAAACERELIAGIRAAFPKPVLAVENTRPHGPCKFTRVNLARVEQAVAELLKKS